MQSNALKNLSGRLQDIEQLLDAHTAITKFRKAEALAKGSTGQLKQIADVVNALVTQPGKGKPYRVEAINRAAFVLLCSHLQGFIDDLHRETAQIMLDGRVSNVDAVVRLIRPRNANPHIDVIEKMFSGLGIYEVMQNIRWQRCSNSTVKERLKNYIETRNKIAHGTQEAITRWKVEEFKKYVEMLAGKLDSEIRLGAKKVTGKFPW